MHREGTMLAIVPRDDATPESAAKAFGRIIARQDFEPAQLSGQSHNKAARSFRKPGVWLRAADVDRLSEQEAEIIAARLVRRTHTKIPLSPDQADALRRALADTARRSFIQRDITFEEAQRLGTDAARRLLNESQFRAFTESMEAGLRALPGER